MTNLTALLSAAVISLASVLPGNNIAETYVDKNNVILYTLDSISDLDIAISGSRCDVREQSSQEYATADKYTLYLADVSSSANAEAQDITITILNELIDGQDKSVKGAVAYFSSEMTIVGSYTSDRYELSKNVKQVEFNGGNTNLYSSVIEAAENVKAEKGSSYGRIVVISDGVEANKEGITYNELVSYLKDCSVQIFTVGIDTGKNSQSLKNLSAMSRETNAPGYILDSDSDIAGVCREINSYISEMNAYAITIPDELKDGSVRRLSVLENGIEIDGADIRMPVMIKENKPAPEIVTTAGKTVPSVMTEQTTVASVDAKPISSSDNNGNIIVKVIIAAGAVGLAVIVIVIITAIRKKNKRAGYTTDRNISGTTGNNTEIYIEGNEENKTSFLFGNAAFSSQNEAEITLREIESGDHNYTVVISGKGTVLTREKLDSSEMQLVIDHDKSVSKNHCTISTRENEVYIHDNGSKNKTYVNGKEVAEERVIKEGDIIRLGRVKLRVEKIRF